ncbi:hypothetical protein CMK18_20925 [Candidatus Poribacteria bacterium]|nr:hypothetical protein [Candidatus Poribacteria bacterium]
MKIPVIFVGLGRFGLQRLKAMYANTQFEPVALVDVQVGKAKDVLKSQKEPYLRNCIDRIFPSITDAISKVSAKACFIFVSAEEHAQLVLESLRAGLHTFCVKPFACNMSEFAEIVREYKLSKNLMLIQGLNNQWNEAATKMRELLNGVNGIGEMVAGQCLCWGRQNISAVPPSPDATIEGLFFHGLACHQLSQLVAAKGLPESVIAYVHKTIVPSIGLNGTWGTGGGQAVFEYDNAVPFSYTGTRAAHGNFFGFASRWSGRWYFQGTQGDLKREGGHITLYKDGETVLDYYLKDLDVDLIEDEKIQFRAFYDALTTGEGRKSIQKNSIDTWILMEACNESARTKNKISIREMEEKIDYEIF